MSRKRKDYSDAVVMYERGHSINEVAKRHGITRQAMWAILRRRGVTFRSPLRYGSANHFYRHGQSYDERVHAITQTAIAAGRLTPQPCEICGYWGFLADDRRAVHAHHDDYNKPLDVRWLCDGCHRDWHDTHAPIRRACELPVMSHRKIASLGGKACWRNREAALDQVAAARACR